MPAEDGRQGVFRPQAPPRASETGGLEVEGIESHRAAVTRHGGRSQATRDFRRMVRELRAEARRMVELA